MVVPVAVGEEAKRRVLRIDGPRGARYLMVFSLALERQEGEGEEEQGAADRAGVEEDPTSALPPQSLQGTVSENNTVRLMIDGFETFFEYYQVGEASSFFHFFAPPLLLFFPVRPLSSFLMRVRYFPLLVCADDDAGASQHLHCRLGAVSGPRAGVGAQRGPPGPTLSLAAQQQKVGDPGGRAAGPGGGRGARARVRVAPPVDLLL